MTNKACTKPTRLPFFSDQVEPPIGRSHRPFWRLPAVPALLPLLASSLRFLGLCVLMVGSLDVSAATLGGLRGAAILGQPLQLAIRVQIAADEEVSAACLQAEVLYGDVRQDALTVRVQAEGRDGTLSRTLTIRSANPINEPIVTVTVHAGCLQKTSQTYVLLADLSAQPRAATTAVAVQSHDQTTSRTGLPLPLSLSAVSNGPASLRSLEGFTPVLWHSNHLPDARLKLANWEPGTAQDLVLKPSDTLLFLEPLGNLARRAQALATWRALTATPESILREDARTQAVEGDLKTFKELTVHNQQSMAGLAERLQQTRQPRFFDPVVFWSVLLVLILAAGIAYMWRRPSNTSRATEPKQGGAPLQRKVLVPVTKQNATKQVFAPAPIPQVAEMTAIEASPKVAERGTYLYVHYPVVATLDAVQSAPHEASIASPAPFLTLAVDVEKKPSGFADFCVSITSAMCAIDVREITDESQQAEFFSALGKNDEAFAY
jgi:hypothetical protein